MSKKTKKTLMIVVVSVMVFVVGGAVAYAATNISDIEELFLAFRTAQVQQAIDSDAMTQEEADAYLSNLTERMEEDEKDAVPSLRGPGQGGKGIRGANAVALYADVSGQSEDDIVAQLKEDDISIFAMADEAGKLDDLKSAMIADSNEKIDELLEDGKIDADKAVQMKEKAAEVIGNITADTDMRNPQGRPAGGRGGMGGHGGMGQADCDGDCEV